MAVRASPYDVAVRDTITRRVLRTLQVRFGRGWAACAQCPLGFLAGTAGKGASDETLKISRGLVPRVGAGRGLRNVRSCSTGSPDLPACLSLLHVVSSLAHLRCYCGEDWCGVVGGRAKGQYATPTACLMVAGSSRTASIAWAVSAREIA
jgi:hypothetical protein